jgi:hypothetical protein
MKASASEYSANGLVHFVQTKPTSSSYAPVRAGWDTWISNEQAAINNIAGTTRQGKFINTRQTE